MISSKASLVLSLSFALAFLINVRTAVSQAESSDARETRLEEVAKSYTSGNAFMGSVLITEGEKILLNESFGSADLEWNIPNGTDTKFRLGSLTKKFTATLILQLQQEGKLQTDTPVGRYLTDTPSAWRQITLINLLGQTSGIPDFGNDPAFSTWSMSPHTSAEEIAFFRDKPLVFAPGTRYKYSNSNFEVLGAVIEKVTGKRYADVLRERALAPLAMNDSGLDADELILPRRAQGYVLSNGSLTHARNASMTVPWAAGGMYSTTADLLRWEHGLFGGKLLSQATLKQMTTAGQGNYGLGVEISTNANLQVVRHGGAIDGFNSYLSYMPERQIAVIVLSNVAGTASAGMASQLLDVALGKQVALISEHRAVPISTNELRAFLGTFQFGPSFALTFAEKEDQLTAAAPGESALTLIYVGLRAGHPTFYAATVFAELEFIRDGSGEINTVILHQAGHDEIGRRH
jgi:CubicO group peptidase (beta-lactamase class C family)